MKGKVQKVQKEYKVVEHFVSINGEGPLAGELSVFIRFKGCNLDCSYCDTKWANKADTAFTKMSAEEIYNIILDTGIKNVTLTGGEPLIQPGIKELLTTLASYEGLRVEIETNGSVSLEQFASIPNAPAFTMDYKLSASGMENSMNTDNFALLSEKDSVKFVAGSVADCERAKEIIDKYSLVGKCHLFISPVFGSIEPVKIVEFMKENKMNGVRLGLQLHKFIWDPSERGV